MVDKLNEKNKLFADEYIKDLHITHAAIRAGYSKKTAHVQGHALLKKPKIQAYIQERMNKRAERTGITQDRVLNEIAKMAFVNAKSLFDENGHLKKINELPDDITAAISGIDISEARSNDSVAISVKKIKFWDKRGSLELLGKHLKLFDGDGASKQTPKPLDPAFL